jgi:signal-transduction protein with cAMP-binding, CBS, and nucleotidyltransferase domain
MGALPTALKVKEVMNSPIITAFPDDDAASIARKMKKYEIGSVVVVNDNGDIMGIVTDGDLIRKVVAEGMTPKEVKASGVMSSPVATIDGESDLAQAAREMRAKGVKRLVVLHNGKPTGVISMSDIINVFPEVLDVLSEKARIMSGESVGHRRYISGFCDQCGRWSDYLVEVDGKFLCEECRSEQGEPE